MTEIKVGNKVVDVSNRGKIFFPNAGITKGDVIDYYERIAEIMLPHMQDRPITMHRFPDGIEGEGFYQKNAPKKIPDWIKSREVENREGGTTQYLLCNDISTLVYMANYGNITPHIWLSRVDNLENPDRMIFDLDPSNDDFDQVRTAARLIYELLAGDLGLTIYLMTTGSRGLHLVVPLDSASGFDDVRDVARKIARLLEEKNQELFTTEIRKNKRKGKLFIDIACNAYAQTTVAPYSLRAKAGAPVAVPIVYDELSESGMNAQKYNLKNIFKRLGRKPDPWQDINKHRFSIDTIKQKLDDLISSGKRKRGKQA